MPRETYHSPRFHQSSSVHLVWLQSRSAVRQGTHEPVGDLQRCDRDQEHRNHGLARLRILARTSTSGGTCDRDWIVHRSGCAPVEDGAANEGRAEMGWEVMMQEELSRHGEEGDVVIDPSKHEEAARVVDSIESICSEAWRTDQLKSNEEIISKRNEGVLSGSGFNPRRLKS